MIEAIGPLIAVISIGTMTLIFAERILARGKSPGEARERVPTPT